MASPDIVLVRETNLLTDLEVIACAAALHRQVNEHVAPFWAVAATVRAGLPGPNSWVVHLRDHSDQAGALGYHDDRGNPVGYVFVADDKRYGLSWTVTASHEVLEIVGDPDIRSALQVPQGFAARELCDPVEADQLGYVIDGVHVSDFVLPAWFGAQVTGFPFGPYDYLGHLKRPLQLAPGGYMSLWTPRHGWTQRTADLVPGEISARAGRARRYRHRQHREWTDSAPAVLDISLDGWKTATPG